MVKKEVIVIFTAIAGIIFSGLVSYVYWQGQFVQSEPPGEPLKEQVIISPSVLPEQPNSPIEDKTGNWKTYCGTGFSELTEFCIDYPGSWIPKDAYFFPPGDFNKPRFIPTTFGAGGHGAYGIPYSQKVFPGGKAAYIWTSQMREAVFRHPDNNVTIDFGSTPSGYSDQEFEDLANRMLATFRFGKSGQSTEKRPLEPVAKPSPESYCQTNGGKWISPFNECEINDPEGCQPAGGIFDPCASSCRHQANTPNNAGICIQVCVPLCTFP